MNLKTIKSPIEHDLLLVNTLLKENLYSKNFLLNKIIKYVFKNKGKQIRPILVLLSAKLCGKITPRSIRAAALSEILHTSSLLHDDVIDNSFKRRGLFSINALWRNKISVLTGDFLLAQTLLKTVQNKDYNLLEIYSDSVKKMSEGEIIQIEASRKNSIDEKTYLNIIYNKTASLFSACCQAGASSISSDRNVIHKIKMVGNCIGMIFQIQDDILDIASKKLNKTNNSDFLDKKITLPLIYALKNSKTPYKIIKIINSRKRQKHIKTITNFIYENNGIEEASKKIYFYENKALSILNTFTESDAKDSLIQLLSYISKRKY